MVVWFDFVSYKINHLRQKVIGRYALEVRGLKGYRRYSEVCMIIPGKD